MQVIELLVQTQEEYLQGIKNAMAVYLEPFGKITVPDILPEGEGVFRLILHAKKVKGNQVQNMRRAVEDYVAFYRDMRIVRIQEITSINKSQFSGDDGAAEQLNFTTRKT